MKKRYPWATPYRDRHGKPRWRFRRKGYAPHSFKAPYGTKDFEREYAACLSAEPIQIGASRIIAGSVADVISRYYSDNAFLDLKPATQTVYRGVLERFRANFGKDPMRRFDAERIARLMNAMRHKPHAAARLRKLLTQLFIIARRAKIVPQGFDPVKDTKPPRAVSDGYHRWSEDELAAFEAKHALGTKPRLAFALLLYGAQRSGDVRLMTHETIEGGRIRLDQSKTSNAVDVLVVEPLQEALDAGPLGEATLLESNRGEPFTPKGFYNLMKRACIQAGLSHCSPHGLRKSAARRCREAGCTPDEGMAITGHKTLKEYLRYAGDSDRGVRADAGMAKVMANRDRKLAKARAQTAELEAENA
ncbi:tyrosine-type recombinase/integrase [Edaphosphingomonas haloaromaticamans]|uniref:Phage integrase family protein n=1 Tax=Edaphosphingomonas haloaromaticamans TaxID=653954 RepID=A0A1S1HJF1_9SPHN|nr:tyrosine-type recombinase/integrase [Sphingomonas haloaromaticamans]OHT22178.1 Phage integrase family protein [Sphingomonas haloaromaticamans]